MYEVGDRVRVLTQNACGSGAKKGKVYTVRQLDGESVQLKEITHTGGWMGFGHVEPVKE
ncbi:hypothetical protein [Carnobacterium jeotgali]|uniref:hypothetical protein n=1 Tax=Carnobacterium jeotgali TaxID=545534 RepID=UPI00388D8C97